MVYPDLLQCVVRDGAGAEVTDVVQTDEHSRATWTGDGRQVAGGFALGALPLVILEVIVFRLLALQHPLKIWAGQRWKNQNSEHVDIDEDKRLCLTCT